VNPATAHWYYYFIMLHAVYRCWLKGTGTLLPVNSDYQVQVEALIVAAQVQEDSLKYDILRKKPETNAMSKTNL
jgi:hypothetical protein